MRENETSTGRNRNFEIYIQYVTMTIMMVVISLTIPRTCYAVYKSCFFVKI